jgi:uncharacterized membrane protein
MIPADQESKDLILKPATEPQPSGIQASGTRSYDGPVPASALLTLRPAPEPQSSGIQTVGKGSYNWPVLVSAVLVAGVNVLVITGFHAPFLRPALGFWFLVAFPVYLLCTTSVWGVSSVAERVGYSTAAVLLLLMITGLGLNTFLPLLGFRRPLDPVPVLLLGDTLLVALYLFRRRYPAKVAWRPQIQALGRQESRLLAGSGLCVAAAVLGANRLNNGMGCQLSLVALGGMVVTLLLLLLWRQRVRDGLISASLYLVSVALLLMTSLRGWYITGHDIQTEYKVFQLTQEHSHWSMSYFHDAYNACLSITILPTEISRVAQVDDPYVFKVFFQVIFALCPVLVYTISRRYWPKSISILATVFFIGFPTFLNDMPFMDRQEIAFIFTCAAILSITNNAWSKRQRQLGLILAAVGMELSHYSTIYTFLDALVIAWAAQFLSALNSRRLRSPRGTPRPSRAPWAVTAKTAGLGSILLIAGVTYLWGQIATQTANNALVAFDSAISGLVHSNGGRSNDVLYGLLPAKAPNPQVLLNDHRETALQERAASPYTYIPASAVARYPTPIINQPVLPFTGAGRILSDVDISPIGFNSAVREFAAKGEQIFIIIGLLALLLVRGCRSQVNREIWFLCVGNLSVLALISILPNLSVQYGILRTFQEALILMAPVLVAGTLTIFSPLGGAWAARATVALSICIFVSTTGLLPQILGGYPAQLSLNNSGLYYDIYYVHPQEVAAVNWLSGKPGILPDGLQASFSAERFTFNSPPDVTGNQGTTDIYPWLIQKSGWVFLSYSTVHTGGATIDTGTQGELITYLYPADLLWNTKNLVYDNGGTEIYR